MRSHIIRSPYLQSPDFARLSLIKKSFKLLEQLSFEGFVFPAELMLFRKAIFTLEGVLYDLDPSFDMNAAIVRKYRAKPNQIQSNKCKVEVDLD